MNHQEITRETKIFKLLGLADCLNEHIRHSAQEELLNDYSEFLGQNDLKIILRARDPNIKRRAQELLNARLKK